MSLMIISFSCLSYGFDVVLEIVAAFHCPSILSSAIFTFFLYSRRQKKEDEEKEEDTNTKPYEHLTQSCLVVAEMRTFERKYLLA